MRQDGHPAAERSPGAALRRALTRLVSTDDELRAAELRHDAADQGGEPIAQCADRARVTVYGTLKTVTLQPRAGVPALEAEIYDGSGTLALVWLGRRRIAGIEPGRALTAHGRVAVIDDRRVMFNPTYELCPAGPG